jgi:hypothetical protein
MMNEELHLQPVEQQSLVRSAVIVTVATLIGHFIPIIPFMVVARTPAIVLAIVLSAVTLFASVFILQRPWSETGARAAYKWSRSVWAPQRRIFYRTLIPHSWRLNNSLVISIAA